MSLRALYVDFNSFFASCEQQERPELRHRPVGIVPMMADSTAILAASYEAKAFGIKTGTKVFEAKKMCPGLVLVQSRVATYVKYHHQVVQAIDSVLPVASVCSIDEVACELTGSQCQPSKAKELALRIKDVVADNVGVYMKCSVGIATNFLLAKIACDMQKPNGLTFILPEERVQKLSLLKLQDFPGIGPRMERRLHAQGIFSSQELLQQNEQQMRTLWGGIVGARYYHLLQGQWSPLKAKEPAKSIGHQHVLPPKERNYEEARLILHKLLSKAMTRVRAAHFLTKTMYISIRYLDQTKFFQEIKFQETQDTGFLIKKLDEIYKRSPQKKPLKVAIVFSGFVQESQHQFSFFENPRREEAFKTVDLINQKYGRDTIHVGTINDKTHSARTGIAFARIPGLEEVE